MCVILEMSCLFSGHMMNNCLMVNRKDRTNEACRYFHKQLILIDQVRECGSIQNATRFRAA